MLTGAALATASAEVPMPALFKGSLASAAGVSMPAPLSGSSIVGSWSWNPIAVGLLVVVGALYALGTVRFRRLRGERWPLHRTVLFCGFGLGGFAVTTMSFLGTYQQVMFWPRAVQIITLLMVVPLFLALGAPIRLAVEAGPRPLASAIGAVLDSRIAKLVTFPAVVSIVFLATPFVVYFSPVYEATLRSRGAAWVLSLVLVGIGFFYYWTRLRLDPVPKEYPHLISVWITFAEAVADGALGLTLMMGHHLVAGDYYAALGRTWGPTLKQDQVWGGGALWLIGDLAGVPFIGALWRRMFHEDRERAAEVDAELDALDAAAAAAAASRTPTTHVDPNGAQPVTAYATVADEESRRSRPWWETDPVLGARYGFLDSE